MAVPELALLDSEETLLKRRQELVERPSIFRVGGGDRRLDPGVLHNAAVARQQVGDL